MKKENITKILDAMDRKFPDAECELHHSNELELLIAVVLSAQTTDESVNKLTKDLFQKYQTVEDYAQAPIEELEQDLRRIGLYRNKAKSVKGLANALIENFDGQVPRDKTDLQTLPGVGRKTANVVASVAFGEPGFAVDTHVERISKRLGFAKPDDSVLEVEKKLMKAIPRDHWIKSHHQFIFWGRYFCKAKSPSCSMCELTQICRYPSGKAK